VAWRRREGGLPGLLDSQVVEAQSQDGPLGNHQGLRGKEVSYQDSLGEEDHQGSQGSHVEAPLA